MREGRVLDRLIQALSFAAAFYFRYFGLHVVDHYAPNHLTVRRALVFCKGFHGFLEIGRQVEIGSDHVAVGSCQKLILMCVTFAYIILSAYDL